MVAERITEFLKVQKVCSSTDYSCFTKGYPKLLNGNVPQWGPNYDIGTNDIYYRVILADGTSLAFLHWGTSSLWELMWFVVDIDGPNKGKYTFGHDVFMFVIPKRDHITYENIENGKLSSYIKNDASATEDNFNCFKYGFCSGWILKTGNTDYFKVDADGNCPNGKKLGYDSSKGKVTKCN